MRIKERRREGRKTRRKGQKEEEWAPCILGIHYLPHMGSRAFIEQMSFNPSMNKYCEISHSFLWDKNTETQIGRQLNGRGTMKTQICPACLLLLEEVVPPKPPLRGQRWAAMLYTIRLPHHPLGTGDWMGFQHLRHGHVLWEKTRLFRSILLFDLENTWDTEVVRCEI